LDNTNSSDKADHSEWFSEWFGTEFYQLLYSHRSHAEADLFIQSLIRLHWFRNDLEVLDLGCGNGRHAFSLAPYVRSVDGIDLSEKQLHIATSSMTAENCRFHRLDMRNFLLNKTFDLVLNLFTSFGYFQTLTEHLNVLHQVNIHLKTGGRFVLDYFNAHFVRTQLHKQEQKIIDGTTFEISRTMEHHRIIKRIKVNDQLFREDVALFDDQELSALLMQSGFKIESVFGNYHLDEFDANTSPRCIIFAVKL
jgi:SAM-dependent methyltransferase